MTDQKLYPPGATVPSGDAPPSYTATQTQPAGGPGPAYPMQEGAAYPTQPGAAYPTQPGVAYPSQPGAQAAPTQQHIPGGDSDQRYSSANISKLRHVPCWPLWLAITLYIVNCIIPGFGMWIGCLCLCCGNTVVKGDSYLSMLCIMFWLGLLSIVTLAFGIGYWIAILWSIGTIANSRMYYGNPVDASEIRQPSAVAMAGMNM